jgi:hypothetical protein
LGLLSLEVKRLKCEAKRSPTPTAKVRNTYVFTCIYLIHFQTVRLKHERNSFLYQVYLRFPYAIFVLTDSASEGQRIAFGVCEVMKFSWKKSKDEIMKKHLHLFFEKL